MRFPPLRFGLRGAIVAVALFALVFAAALELSGARKQRTRSLGWAREYRWYESRIREDIARYEACGKSHRVEMPSPGFCRSCGVYLYVRDFTGQPVGSQAEAAGLLRIVADLFARIAARNERDALRPWADPAPVPVNERDTMILLHSGQGPISPKFFAVY
ncbi:hypothetical protein [Singulisphaera sp. PoT]|uniref:hypothetical protein n=1 Tax=Singulisphaera sp. PoT TaxID=3411797 RepID=UPI003BF482F5